MIIKCPECGHQVSDQAETCPGCGVAIAQNMMVCKHCGTRMLKSQMVCQNCKKENKPSKRRTLWIIIGIAATFALILVSGGFGFYYYTQSQNEAAAYDNAMHSTEIAVLQNYLDIYSSAPAEHQDSIVARLEVLKHAEQEWQNAVTSGSKASLVHFLQSHPASSHELEAKQLIDSLDWLTASHENSMEAYQNYLDNYGADGLHYDEAKMNCDKLASLQVTPEEQQMISQLFERYFTSLSHSDENTLLTTLGTVLNSFLHKPNASKADVVNYMKKLHRPEDVRNISYILGNDWTIEKIRNIDMGDMEYAVLFSVDQRIGMADADKEQIGTFKVTAKVSASGKITELNMKKVVQ